MSSLIPERQLVISPSLAATIGLEEALLLQVLADASQFSSGRHRRGQIWHDWVQLGLADMLPFWDQSQLQTVLNSLRDKGVIELNGSHYALHQSSNNPHEPSIAPSTSNPHTKIAAPGATPLSHNWQPSDDLLELLARNHSIPKTFALEQLEDFRLYWQDRGQVSHSWSSKFRQHVLKEWRHHQSRQPVTDNNLRGSWRPSADAMEILVRAGITSDFIEDAVPEFVLYWQERGDASTTWNSKFIAHIRRQWAKYNQTLVLDYEPRPIPADWQPSEDVYDILRLANIDIAFARQLVPEFVLFWRDTKEIQRSWNTKFLQHVKYQWATRHHMEQRYAGQSNRHQSTLSANQSPFQQLTDRSWAEGIVDDLEGS